MRRTTFIHLAAWTLTVVLSQSVLVGGVAANAGQNDAGRPGVTSPVTDPATLCLVAFNDTDANAERGSDEAALPGWVATIRDANGATVGSIVTDAIAPACINLLAGSYDVIEHLEPGWQATTNDHATQVVTLISAATTTVTFGNHRCCVTFTFRGGKADDFSLANGARAEPVTPVSASSTLAYFDATKGNRVLAQRFRLGTANCVRSATVRIRLRALPGGSTNDILRLRVPGGASWTKRIEGL